MAEHVLILNFPANRIPRKLVKQSADDRSACLVGFFHEIPDIGPKPLAEVQIFGHDIITFSAERPDLVRCSTDTIRAAGRAVLRLRRFAIAVQAKDRAEASCEYISTPFEMGILNITKLEPPDA